MKTASIALRIADFLKGFPPFEFLDTSELVSLAERGRVKFHEIDEVIFSAGQPRDRFLYVINQGRVRIIDETTEGPRLMDLRGPGEILGLQGVISDEPYINTALAESDCLLYGLPREAFAELAENAPRAQRYLAAYFSLNPAYRRSVARGSRMPEPDSIVPMTLLKGGLQEVEETQMVAREALVTVSAGAPAIEAARLLRSKRIACVIVVDERGCPLGKITDADLRDRFIEGQVLESSTAADLMFTDLVLAKPGDDTGKLLVRMIRSGKRFLVVTEDGTLRTRTIGLVTERNIFLQFGRFPTLLGEAMSEAPSIEVLRMLRNRMEALLLEFLEDREHMPWLMQVSGVLNRLMTARVLRLSEAEMAAEGWKRPEERYTWLMMGSGGRDELLIRSAVYHALMYEDPPQAEAAGVEGYFRELGRRASGGLRQCGFLESPQGILAREADWCQPVSRMMARYSRMITHPMESLVYNFRDAFDFRPVNHRCPLAIALREHINRELRGRPDFLRHMATDSLLNQPPRTLFQHYVIDEQGIQKEELEIKHHALLPLVDVARVLALAAAEVTTTSTSLRFLAAADHLEGVTAEESTLFREAAAAFRFLAYARARVGLLNGTDGVVIRPVDLEVELRPLLKTSFRTILATLEALAKRYDLKLRP